MIQKIIAILLTGVFINFTTPTNPPQQKPRMVTITLTENTWRVLFFVVNKADVPHPTVTALQDSLYIQFNQQLAADSTKKK